MEVTAHVFLFSTSVLQVQNPAAWADLYQALLSSPEIRTVTHVTPMHL